MKIVIGHHKEWEVDLEKMTVRKHDDKHDTRVFLIKVEGDKVKWYMPNTSPLHSEGWHALVDEEIVAETYYKMLSNKEAEKVLTTQND